MNNLALMKASEICFCNINRTLHHVSRRGGSRFCRLLPNTTNRPWCREINMTNKTACEQGQKQGQGCLESYDIVIAGGGLVGTALACLLGKDLMLQNHKVLLLEAAPKQDFLMKAPEDYSNRVSSVTPGTRNLLDEIGAWEHVTDLRYKPYTKMHVWDACGAGYITFNANEVEQVNKDEKENHMAYIIENSVILSALARQLRELQSNVHVMYNSRIEDVTFPKQNDNFETDHVFVHMEDGKIYNTKLLVGADGVNSVVRKKAEMKYFTHDYKQSCIVATLHLDKETDNNIAWQRFLPTGPIAMLPLSSDRSSLAWSTTSEDAKTLAELPEDAFVDAVNTAFWEDCDRHPLIEQAGSIVQNVISTFQPGTFAGSQLQQPPSVCGVDSRSRGFYPLGLGHASHYVNNRVALIGDAAHRVHPLAGQGLNLGASDVVCLRDVLIDAVENGEDIGDLNHLLRYETLRQREVVPMMTAVDSLKRLFSTSSYPFVFARTIGLQATNALKPLKDQFIHYAMK